MTTTEKALPDPKLGDRVKFTGIIIKKRGGWKVRYEDAPLHYFEGYSLDGMRRWVLTKHIRDEGIIVGKRLYRSMENDEGLWVPDTEQRFTAYLVAYHLSRKPVIVRLDQMVPLDAATPKEAR